MIQHTRSDRKEAMEVRWVIQLTVLRCDEVSVDNNIVLNFNFESG